MNVVERVEQYTLADLAKQVDDVYGNIPCDRCVSSDDGVVNPAEYWVKWDAIGCCKDGKKWLFCKECAEGGGNCRFCGREGHYEIIG
jgi:hypothetical protein